jgi:hypothetical protein
MIRSMGANDLQPCSTEGCARPAAFRTRSRPSWCEACLAQIHWNAGLRGIDPPQKYGVYRLTECIVCGVQAHYLLEYVLDRNRSGERTCRACFWRQWAAQSRGLAPGFGLSVVPEEKARSIAHDNGYEYLRPLTTPSLPDDPHLVRCRSSCGRISAQRLADIGWGCPCSRNQRTSQASSGPPRKITLAESDSPAMAWWDHARNDAELLATLTPKARREVAWVCPDCSKRFKAKVFEMSEAPNCPGCSARRQEEAEQFHAVMRTTRVSEVPALLRDWAEEQDPRTVMVAGTMQLRRFQCGEGHHPRLTPLSYLRNGCPFCRAAKTRAAGATAHVGGGCT